MRFALVMVISDRQEPMTVEANPAYIWKAPREAERYMFSIHVKMWKAVVPRVVCVTAAILLVVFGFLWNILPEDILASLKWGFLGVFGAAMLYCFLFFVHPLFSLVFGTGYEIDEARILKRGITGDTTVVWADVTGYSVLEDQQFPDLVLITAHTKDRRLNLWLSKGRLAEQVITTFAERCALVAESQGAVRVTRLLTDAQYIYLLVLTLFYSLAVGFLLHAHGSVLVLVLVCVVTVMLGPGTLGCLLLYGTRTVKDRFAKAYAGAFNVAGLVLLFFFFILFELYHWSKIIKELAQ